MPMALLGPESNSEIARLGIGPGAYARFGLCRNAIGKDAIRLPEPVVPSIDAARNVPSSDNKQQ